MIEDFNVFTEHAQLIAKRAYEIALQHRHFTIDESHVLLSLLELPDEMLKKIFDFMSLDVQKIKDETYVVMKRQPKVAFWKGRNYQFFTTSTIKSSIENAVSISKNLGEEKVSSAHIFAGLVNASLNNHHAENGNNVAQLFVNSKITPEKVLEGLKIVGDDSMEDKST
jgi:ATP-dependent Clp protease ATP-binding subunit ClpA